jgi:hypothetical protein
MTDSPVKSPKQFPAKDKRLRLVQGPGFDRRKWQIGNLGLGKSKGNITCLILVITGEYDPIHSLLVPFLTENL